MLCGEAGEGQAPHSLELLYRAARVSSPADAVMVAAHLLMLETGFTPQVRNLRRRSNFLIYFLTLQALSLPCELAALWR